MKLLSSSVLSCGTVLLCCYPASSREIEGPLLAGYDAVQGGSNF